MTEPRIVPGKPADVEMADEVVQSLPWDDESIIGKPITPPVHCSECDGTRGFHKTNCPHYRD